MSSDTKTPSFKETISHKNTLSANTLFHFTNSMENLISILTNKFYPRYSLEDWDNIMTKEFKIAVLMSCFCDIPLSQINNHTNNYGKYALGLTKEWGMKKGICPVLYTFNEAQTATHILNLKIDEMIRTNGKDLDHPISKLWLFMKPYIGTLKSGEKKHDEVRFYDEREWRYIPNKDKGENISLFLGPNEYEDIKGTEKERIISKNKKLSFEPEDIKYIIVDNEKEILPLFKKIQEIKDKYSQDEIELLQTRIVSMEHIRDDF